MACLEKEGNLCLLLLMCLAFTQCVVQYLHCSIFPQPFYNYFGAFTEVKGFILVFPLLPQCVNLGKVSDYSDIWK